MLKFSFESLPDEPLVHCLGAHCDDIEIGCGATILRLREIRPKCRLKAIIFCSNPEREAESRRCFEQLLGPEARIEIGFGAFEDGYLAFDGRPAKNFLRQERGANDPDIVFSHRTDDAHQDHRMVGRLAEQVYRNSLILETEIPKYDGDLGPMNFYVQASVENCDSKVSSLMAAYVSQQTKCWFTPETFKSILRIRGIECRSESGYAEAFRGKKIIAF